MQDDDTDELDELTQWHDDREDLGALSDHMDDLDPSGRSEPKARSWYA